MIPGTPVQLFRGTTVFFSTTFFDKAGAITQPAGAEVHLQFQRDGEEQTASIEMTGPMSPAVQWTAEWDSRGIDPGLVSWSIHSENSLPYAVEDGSFILSANNANLETF